MKQGEILTHIIVPRENYEGYFGHYIKYSMRNAMDIATLSCSVVCKPNLKSNVLEDIRITFGVAARCRSDVKPQKPNLKEWLLGKNCTAPLRPLSVKRLIQEIPGVLPKAFRLQIGGEIANVP